MTPWQKGYDSKRICYCSGGYKAEEMEKFLNGIVSGRISVEALPADNFKFPTVCINDSSYSKDAMCRSISGTAGACSRERNCKDMDTVDFRYLQPNAD